MTHARKQIRDKIVTLLTGLTTTGSNITGSRVYTIDETALPHLSVYTTEESLNEDMGVMGNKEFRDLTVLIEGRIKAVDTFDDQADQVAAEVETALAANPTLDNLVKNIDLLETSIQLEGESDKPTGLLTLTYNAEYRIDRTDPETIIN